MKQIVIYGRVSTADQRHDSQVAEVQQYVQRRWPDANAVIITDTASGAKASRKGLDRLVGLVRRGKTDAVVCYKIDRLARSLSHFAAMVHEFDHNRVALVVTSQGIDTSSSNPAGRLQMHVLGAVAEFERSLVVERTNAGLAAARRRGVVLGRPVTTDRFRKDVQHLLAKGWSLHKIATELKLSLTSVWRLSRLNRLSRPSN